MAVSVTLNVALVHHYSEPSAAVEDLYICFRGAHSKSQRQDQLGWQMNEPFQGG